MEVAEYITIWTTVANSCFNTPMVLLFGLEYSCSSRAEVLLLMDTDARDIIING